MCFLRSAIEQHAPLFDGIGIEFKGIIALEEGFAGGGEGGFIEDLDGAFAEKVLGIAPCVELTARDGGIDRGK